MIFITIMEWPLFDERSQNLTISYKPKQTHQPKEQKPVETLG